MKSVTLAYPYDGHQPDETIEVEDGVADQLVADGWARFGVSSPTTVADVLAAVGNDPYLAAAALAREEASASPRSSLVAALGKLVGPQ